MTARRAAIGDLPNWPRLLSRDQAAAYLGVSGNHFDDHIAAGIPPMRSGRRVLYDRLALDRWVDQASGVAPASPEQNRARAREQLNGRRAG